MIPPVYPPLRVGDILEPRKDSELPRCTITNFSTTPEGMIWLHESSDKRHWRLTLSQVYAEFKFGDEPL